MRLRAAIIVITILLAGTTSLTAALAENGSSRSVTVSELEDELTEIEKELTSVEKEIDTLLEDLVDPRITSLSIFFSLWPVILSSQY